MAQHKQQDSIFSYSNMIPDAYAPSSLGQDTICQPSDQQKAQKSQKKSLLWPGIAVCVPMPLICVLLLTIIFVYEVKPNASLFGTSHDLEDYERGSYLLVKFSATQLAYLTSFISTLGPLLTGSIMSLASLMLFQNLKAPQGLDASAVLPTPYQMSLLIGMIAATFEQLWKALTYLLSRKRTTKAPAVLWCALAILCSGIFLGLAVTIADAAFHTLVSTVSFTLYSSLATTPSFEYGRGLDDFCANFDRVKINDGFPCTLQMDTDYHDPNNATDQAEIQNLMYGTSTKSEIRYASPSELNGTEVAYLIPKSGIDSQTDYRATTFGVSAQCHLVPPSTCNISRWGSSRPIYTSFNCSNNFWGAMGLPPNITNSFTTRQPSAYIPLLGIKPQSNLQYGFFTDPSLQTVYNPAGFNDSAQPDPLLKPMEDSQLASKLFMAFAWRTSYSSFFGGVHNEMTSSNMTAHGNLSYADYFLNCELQAYNLEYTWFENSPQTVGVLSVANGTLLNMWQGGGSNWYGPSINGGGHFLQGINAQAAVAGSNITSYETKFGSLLSQQILATIGAFTSPRTVLEQQSKQTLLLTKIPKVALGTLVGCSLIYLVLGVFLIVRAQKMLRENGDMTQLFSYWGLASSAWDENSHHRRSALITADAVESCQREEKLRLYIDRRSIGGFRFAVWRNGQETDQKSHLQDDDIGLAV